MHVPLTATVGLVEGVLALATMLAGCLVWAVKTLITFTCNHIKKNTQALAHLTFTIDQSATAHENLATAITTLTGLVQELNGHGKKMLDNRNVRNQTGNVDEKGIE
jgi:cell division protein FtsB